MRTFSAAATVGGDGAQASGRRIVKVLPAPGTLSTASVPPCVATMERAIGSPSPAPPVSRARAASSRTKGSKMRSTSAGSIPMPVSVTATSARPSVTRSASSTRPPRGVYFTAFSTSFITARRSAIASPVTVAGARSLTTQVTPRSSATRAATSATSASSGASSMRSPGTCAGTERRERSSRAPACRAGHGVHRAERRARDDRAPGGRERQAERDQDQERLEIAPERPLGPLERDADLEELNELAVARDRQRQQAHGLARGAPHGLERPHAARGVLSGLGGERERLLAQVGRARAEPTLGVHELEELVVELGPEDLPERRLGSDAEGGARSRPAGVADDQPHRQEGGVEILHEAGAQERVREPADHDEDRQENRGVPQRQAGADRELHRAPTHSAARST